MARQQTQKAAEVASILDDAEEPETFTTVELGKIYRDEIHPQQLGGICTSIHYHASGCTSVHLGSLDANGKPVTYDVLVSRLIGYEGDPSDHPQEVKDFFLNQKFRHKQLGIEGYCGVYTANRYAVDRMMIKWMKADRDYATGSFDITEMEAAEELPIEEAKPSLISRLRGTKKEMPPAPVMEGRKSTNGPDPSYMGPTPIITM
jgi:hypothetical protein